MAGDSDFKAFATGVGANVLTQAEFEALASLIADGFVTGIAPSNTFNKVFRQSSFVAAVIMQFLADELGDDSEDDGDLNAHIDRLRSALQNIAAARAGVTGALGNPDGGDPDNVFALDALEVTLIDHDTGAGRTIRAGLNVSCNIATAGPAANGRDQAGAFANDSWCYFYWIWNGALLRSISSASGPAVGPTLPDGYTHWAFAAALRIDGAGDLLPSYLRGDDVFYALQRDGGIAENAAWTALDISDFVPPEALTADVHIRTLVRGNDDNYALAHVQVSIDGTNLFASAKVECGINGGTNDADLGDHNYVTVDMPCPGQQIYYKRDTDAGTTETEAKLFILGYRIPNGG